jgi:hypothetical protein
LLVDAGVLWRFSRDHAKPVGEMAGFHKNVADALAPGTSADLAEFYPDTDRLV